jgi:nitrous oxidase accessory protein NosD
MPTDCTVHVSAGAPIAPHLQPGAVVCLGPGVHRGGLLLSSSVTLRGDPGAVLDAGGSGPVLRVDADELKVRVENLELRNGHAEGGAGISLAGWSEVDVVGCTITGNRAAVDGGGAGAWAIRGTLRIANTAFHGNTGKLGSDLAATGAAVVDIRDSTLAGDAWVDEGATVTLTGVKVAGALHARGTSTRAPSLSLSGCQVLGGIDNDAKLPATLVVQP